jgi:hypothetical protein
MNSAAIARKSTVSTGFSAPSPAITATAKPDSPQQAEITRVGTPGDMKPPRRATTPRRLHSARASLFSAAQGVDLRNQHTTKK